MAQRHGREWMVVVALALLSAAALMLGPSMRGVEAQDGAAVSIIDFAFEPASLEVATGTTVTWTNTGQERHTATADDGSFDSGRLRAGESFSFTFNTPGTFAYHCDVHPDMTGTIIVTGEAVAATPGAGQVGGTQTGTDQDSGRQTAKLPTTGVGSLAPMGGGTGLALLAGLVAAVLSLAAVWSYRRA
jgi:plastocyanin